MVTDGQVQELRRLLHQGKSLAASARMTQMSQKTARDYRDDERLPSQRKSQRNYRTRVDPFVDVWQQVQKRLQDEPRLKAKTLFEWLQDAYPGKFPDSTRRTFERRVSKWRALHGPAKNVFFSQQHHPGRLAASDFTVCNALGVKIAGKRFDHTFFHCVLTYSNVESVSLCFSESFEALSEGIQKAFWEFGGVPQRHRTDSLSAAVRNHSSQKTLTDRYAALMDHYGCQPERTNARCANENGDVESSNGHLKDRIDQALLLRGSRDFASRNDYVDFVEALIVRGNVHRQKPFCEEERCLAKLPDHRLDTDDLLQGISVSKSSTIQVRTNTYSVPSRLIGRKVDVRISAEQIDVSYQGHCVQVMQRLFGKKGMSINYRHVIDSLRRKPGAFANYRYREEMFPTSQFRIAYDVLCGAHSEKVADKKYIQILELAAKESQDAVADALRLLIASDLSIDVDQVRLLIQDAQNLPGNFRSATDVTVQPPDLTDYDSLLHTFDKDSQSDDENSQETGLQASAQAGQASQGTTGDVADRSAAGTSAAELPGSLRAGGDASSDGESQPPGLPFGTDDTGMRNPPRGPHQTLDESFEATVGQNLGVVQLRSFAVECSASAGDASRWLVPESPRERSAVWQAGQWEEPCVVCVVGAADSSGSQHVVYDLQLAGSTITDGQAGLASSEADQAVAELRGFDHRRPWLCATEPRRDGSIVHAVGGALRARKCVTDEQFGFQQVGSDLQGCDDDGSRDRPAGSSQRDYRAERTKLPSGNSEENKIDHQKEDKVEFIEGNSNCR